jgi:hypothetical protein
MKETISTSVLHLVSINCRYSHSCLAQFYVREEFKRHLPDHSVQLSQLTINDPYYQTLLYLAGFQADALLFSVYIWNHGYVRRLVNDLVHLLPETSLVLGGPQATAMAGLPVHCSVVDGEIEAIDTQFYTDLAQGTLQPLYKAGKSRTFPSPYLEEDFHHALKNRQLYYESSRGCPFSCAYCLSSISKGVRHKPLDLVKRELTELIAADPMIIKFVDRTFNDDPERALAIWQFLVRNGRSVKCHFEIAPDRFTEEMIDFLKTVKCDQFQFEIGIQSCTEATLDAVHRQMDVKRAEEYICKLMALDTIHLHVDLILGLPYETRTSFAASFNQVFRLAPHYIQLGLLKVLPDTEMARRAVEYGLVFCNEPPYGILATNWLSHGELARLYLFCEVVEAFFNNRYFRTLWKYLLNTEANPFDFFNHLLEKCLANNFFQLAKTHKLMHRLLYELVADHPEAVLLHELLCFDWFRCGQKNLPEYCSVPSQKDIRNRLRHQLPENLAGIYDYRSRVEFFKQATFFHLSAKAAAITGCAGDKAFVAILSEQERSVMQHCKIIPLPCQ